MKIRNIGFLVLEAVLVDKKHAHILLRDLNLSARDHAFVSRVVYGVLQNKMYLEYHIDTYIKKKTDIKTQLVLLMGTFEGLFMDAIPDYAVVHEYVELTKNIGLKRQSGFVNAVLKKVLQNGLLEVEIDSLEGVSIKTSVPLWILQLLKSQYSEQFAIDYAYYSRNIKPVYGWINKLKYNSDSENYIHNGIVNRDVFRSDLIKKSHIVIQDINSQKVVDQMPLKKGMRVLDCCCAPGTKTLRIANRLENTGEIIGVDVAPVRVELTRFLMENGNVRNASILLADATDVSFDQPFDTILIDAPCSGLGVISHKHDIRYNISPKDLDELQILQQRILKNISKYIKVGGIISYSTCTLNKKENEKQIETFLRDHDNFELVFEKTMNPVETNGDGFYLAQIKRKW